MKKLFVSALLAGWALVAAAQPAPGHEGCVSIFVQGGPVLNLYENAFSYRENGVAAELFTFQGSAGIGFDFSEAFALRGQVAYGNDVGSCNTRQTSGGGFYPYHFRHANVFVDAILNLSGLKGRASAFRPRLYAGIGGAYTFGFNPSDNNAYYVQTGKYHPWQAIKEKNIVPGFRAGFIAEYTVPSGFGIFADLCGEAYTDMYNGLMPSKQDQENYEGYGGFPWDLRGLLSLGMVYYF